MFKFYSSLLSFLLISALPIAPYSQTLLSWQMATVKVRSYPCHTERPVLEGSGLLFKEGDKVTVLSSEHVLIHSPSTNFCHEIVTASGLRTKATTSRISFLNGLATLDVPTTNELRSRAVALDFNSKSINPSDEVIALGYPHSSFSLQTLTGGRVTSLQSQRASIPQVDYTIEASGLPVEYGMSGGLLLTKNGSDQYALAGILSHQVLKRRPSMGSANESLNPTSSADLADLSLSIPAVKILQWLKGPSQIEVTRDPEGQLSGLEILRYGSLSFQMKNSSLEDLFNIGGRAHGGADGSGIGGADGTGIGGSSFVIKNELFDSVEVFFANDTSPEQKSIPFQNSYLEKWRLSLLKGQKVSIPFFRVLPEARLQAIPSLSYFFKMLEKEDVEPVGLLSKKNSKDLDFISELQKVAVKAQKAREESMSVLMISWLGWLRDQSLLAQSGLLTSDQLLKLLEETPDLSWQEFYIHNFEAAVELNSHIQKAATMMKSRGL